MTVTTTLNKISYIGNGIATEFAVPFPFLETSHLKVYQLLNDIQTQRTDWTVQSGNLLFQTPPQSNAQIVIVREVPLIQETDYRDNEILAAETLERNLDKLTMQVQQLQEKTNRAVTVDIFDDTEAAELLPCIRRAVSDAASYALAATEQAQSAISSAAMAGGHAELATQKATEAIETLENKADQNMNNLTVAGKENLIALAIPDYSRKVVLSAGTAYTASCAGVFTGYYRGHPGTGTTYTVDGFTQTFSAGYDVSGNPIGTSFSVFVPKGAGYSATRANTLYFIPLKGAAE